MILNLTRSETVRVRNLLCKEICVLSENGALDPKQVPKTDLRRNIKALEYDRTALEKVTGDADAACNKFKQGRWWKGYQKHLNKPSPIKAIMEYVWVASDPDKSND